MTLVKHLRIFTGLLLFINIQLIFSQTFYVATSGNNTNPGTEAQPWQTIQKAFNSATSGSTVYVKAGTYNEKLTMNVSGSAGACITFRNYGNDTVKIDGTGIVGDQIILIENKNYIKIIGFELQNNLDQTFGTGIWVQGYGDHIELRNNRIHDMKAAIGGGDAMGISVYGSHASIPISNIIIDSNQIYNCQPGHSESLTLNGNVDTFQVTNNLVHDNDNIGIDMIGGEGTCPTSSLDDARNGICAGNTVYNCRSNYGGGYAAGIYVDGGNNITIERNRVYQCDVGMEIGCENHARIASGMIVRNNLIYDNDKGGLGFGGYNYPTTGQVTNSSFTNNTFFRNDTLGTDRGEMTIEYALNCTIKNNIFMSNSRNRLMTTTVGNSSGNIFDYNLWFTPGGINNASVDYNGAVYTSYTDYKTGTGQDAHSLFLDPQFLSTSLLSPDLHVQPTSPVIETGDPSFNPVSTEFDYDNNQRFSGNRIDIGAFEYQFPLPPPAKPVLVSVTGTPTSPTLRWKSSPGATNYRLQVTNDYIFTTPVFDDSTLTDTTKQIGPLPDSTIFYWRVNAKNEYGDGDWSAVWSFSTITGNFSDNVSNRWNLISLPLLVSNPLKSSIFPSASSSAYAYQSNAYAVKETLTSRTGYWLKFNGAQTVSYSGSPITDDTIDVSAGWNLLGSISSTIATASIGSLPGGIVTSNFYGYNGSYFATDSIRPGRGYWVKVNQDAKLVLSTSGNIPIAQRILVVHGPELPPSPPDGINLQRPVDFELFQNYPNPFNPLTNFEFRIVDFGFVTLKIYDALGREVATLMNEVKPPGTYTVSWDGSNSGSGMYFYRFQAGGFIETKKMVLIK